MLNNLSRVFFRKDGSNTRNTLLCGIIGGIIAFLSVMMPNRSAKKIVTMVLLGLRMPVKEVVDYGGFKKSCVYNLRGGMQRLNSGSDFLKFVSRQCTVKKGRGRKSPIRDIEDAILEHLETVNCFTQAEIQQWIHDEYEINVSRSHLAKFLKEHGYRKLKGGSIPAKADVIAQKEYYQDTFLPLVEKSEGKKHALFFMDASHFVLGSDFIGSVYCKVRRFARTFSGRKRYNVLGALDYATKKVITVTKEKYINADAVCEMFQKLRSEYKGKIIDVILDNARYQKCKRVFDCAKALHINLHYLPSYSPNMNLIERFWRFVKTELRRTAWDNYKDFCESIDKIIDSSTKENKARVESLIGEKVQLFDNYVSIDKNTFAILPTSTEKLAA